MSSESSGIRRHLIIVGSVILGVMVLIILFALKNSKPGDSASSAESAHPVQPILEDNQSALSGYAGSTSCRECHTEEHAKWAASNHGLAEREYRPDLDDVAFSLVCYQQHFSKSALHDQYFASRDDSR